MGKQKNSKKASKRSLIGNWRSRGDARALGIAGLGALAGAAAVWLGQRYQQRDDGWPAAQASDTRA